VRRYAETLFRYWLIALVPLVVLPLADYAFIRYTPKTLLTSANIWVNQSVADQPSLTNQYLTPAQIEANTLSQLLQSPSFDLAVARGSSIYRQMLARAGDPGTVALQDLSAHVQIAPAGDNVLTVSYTSKNWSLGPQVINSFLSTALKEEQALNQQQTKSNMASAQAQLQNAQQRLATSSQKLSDYMTAQNIAPKALLTDQALDPTLATLYQQYQADQANVASAQQQLTKLQAQSALPATVVEQAEFQVLDHPRVNISSASRRSKELTNVAIAALVGLLLSGGFVVVKTALDRSLRYADEVPELLGLPVLAVVPHSNALATQHTGPQSATSQPRVQDGAPELRQLGVG
jgi:capsular polysaccharide biosynthesis protein